MNKANFQPKFLHYCIQDLHVHYQEVKLPGYTTTKLILDVENKYRCFKTHAEVWDKHTPSDNPAMAQKAITNHEIPR